MINNGILLPRLRDQDDTLMNNKPVLFSGVQPSGELHIGNYLGALKHWVELQNENKYLPIFCVVDYHSLTQDYNPVEKQSQILNTAVTFLALGIDPKKSIIFVQSQVAEHTELAWILNCLTPMAELERMTQYKDKAQQQKDNINVGLFDYPVLMAADILLYRTAVVPVGEDQVQHVELARVLARKFNQRYKTDFMLEPKSKLVTSEISTRIMALSDPGKKMSKSLGSKAYIALSDSPEVIKEKIKAAVTTATGAENLLNLLDAFSPNKDLIHKFNREFETGTIKYATLKPVLAEAIIKTLQPIQDRQKYYLNNSKKVSKILADGKHQARKIAEKNLQTIKKIIGVLS